MKIEILLRSFLAASEINVVTLRSVIKYRVNRRDQNSIMQRELKPDGVEFFLQHLERFLEDIKTQDPKSSTKNKQLFIYRYLKNICWEFQETSKKYPQDILSRFATKLTGISLSLMIALTDLYKIITMKASTKISLH